MGTQLDKYSSTSVWYLIGVLATQSSAASLLPVESHENRAVAKL